jgi:hypothetical protein
MLSIYHYSLFQQNLQDMPASAGYREMTGLLRDQGFDVRRLVYIQYLNYTMYIFIAWILAFEPQIATILIGNLSSQKSLCIWWKDYTGWSLQPKKN